MLLARGLRDTRTESANLLKGQSCFLFSADGSCCCSVDDRGE